MGKKGIKLLSGLLVLILLLASYFVLRQNNQEETEEAQPLLDIDTSAITEVSVKTDSKTLKFVKGEENWSVEGEEGFPLNETEVQSLLTDLTEIQISKTLEDVEDLSEFELDDPEDQITIQMEDGTEYCLDLGMENTSLSQYYLMLEGGSEVYLADSSDFTFLDQDLYDYAEKSSFPVIASSELRTVKVETGDSAYQYINEGSEGSNSSWSVSQNGEDYAAADSEVVTNINTSINSLAYTDMVDYNCTEKAEYGLEDPAAVLTIDYEVEVEEEDDSDSSETAEDSEEETEETETRTEDRHVVLYVGNDDGNGYYYVCQDDSNEIYTIYTDTLDTILGESYDSMLDKTVSYVALTDLEQLQIICDGEEAVLETVEEEEESEEDTESDSADADSTEDTEESEEESTVMKYYVNQKEVESGDFTTFYSKLISESGQSRNDGLSEEGLTCELELHFTKTDGSTVDVYYYPYDTNFYLAVNGEKKILVNKMDVKEIKETLQGLME